MNWDLSPLYPSLEAWNKEFDQPVDETSLLRHKGKLGQVQELVETLSTFFDLSRAAEKLFTWAHLKHDEDITATGPKIAYEKALTRLQRLQELGAWIQPEIVALDETTFHNLIRNPELATYKFFLEKTYRLKPHTLSQSEEELLAAASQPLQTAYKAFSALNNADFVFPDAVDGQGKPQPLTHARYGLYLQSPDRALRESTFKTYHKKYSEYKNTLCDLLQGQIQAHAFEARKRNFKSALEAALKPKNVPLEVYTNLIRSVRNRLPSLHRYFDVRKKALGVDQLQLWDMNVPLVADVERLFPYNEGEKLVIDSVTLLGDEYQSILRSGLQKEAWVDRFEKPGKRSGAYSSGCYDSHPYILMNYKEILRDVYTLAHEAGHSMHSYFSRKNQPYHLSDYPIFVAEVASTFNEQLLFEHLLKERPDDRAWLTQAKIDDIRSTLFRQTMFAEFELWAHEMVEGGNPLTPESLEEKYVELVRVYFGPNVTIDDSVAAEWARIPHFYYNFYVYQYATGISAAIALHTQVKSGSPTKYLRFLKSGGSNYPIQLLQEAGVDMTKEEPISLAINYFDGLVQKLNS